MVIFLGITVITELFALPYRGGELSGVVLAVPIIHPCLEHPLLDASLGDESLLHGFEQLVEHVHGLVDKRDAQVGNLLVVHLLHGLRIVLLYLLAPCILPHLLVARMQAAPLCQVAHAQIVLVVVEQFLQAGFRHIGELDFRLA